jgi:hypothetical protein
MQIKIYISFDLSIRGDYKGFYSWLDKNNAEERGNGYAYIKDYFCPDKVFSGAKDFKEKNTMFFNYLKKDIKKFAEISNSDRIYVTLKVIDSDYIGGVFLFGRKQSSPWEGFNNDSETNNDFDFS